LFETIVEIVSGRRLRGAPRAIASDAGDKKRDCVGSAFSRFRRCFLLVRYFASPGRTALGKQACRSVVHCLALRERRCLPQKVRDYRPKRQLVAHRLGARRKKGRFDVISWPSQRRLRMAAFVDALLERSLDNDLYRARAAPPPLRSEERRRLGEP